MDYYNIKSAFTKNNWGKNFKKYEFTPAFMTRSKYEAKEDKKELNLKDIKEIWDKEVQHSKIKNLKKSKLGQHQRTDSKNL
jgi:hypothetical protein